MSFVSKPRSFKASIGALTFGPGPSAVTIGGGGTLPLHFFDAKPDAPPRLPKVGVEVADTGFAAEGLPLLAACYDGAATLAERVRRAASLDGADFVCLRFEGADPGGVDRPVEECVALAKEALDASPLPVAIAGCKNVEKDTALFTALAEALQGRNVLFLSAREEDYKQIGAAAALAYGHKVGAESAVDINLAKQLNVLMTQLGVPKESIAMNVGGAAAGYGFEYVASTMDRVRAAALEQEDAMLQMPIVTLVSQEAWAVKESIASAEDVPEWGELEQRAIQMEAVTAAACLASGSDAVVLRHPVTVGKIAALIKALGV
ncbi:MAG: acetyl-CoA decarbonylase/synthase complex subunit delta [Acidobacteriota bacterium]|jgi:acetyl-CoA decarbonylase/synthase complex subunit delta|nr:acetyl-CoA decarbonylase/synthase complex subunit delta [Acidobacteriota bacterium]